MKSPGCCAGAFFLGFVAPTFASQETFTPALSRRETDDDLAVAACRIRGMTLALRVSRAVDENQLQPGTNAFTVYADIVL